MNQVDEPAVQEALVEGHVARVQRLQEAQGEGAITAHRQQVVDACQHYRRALTHVGWVGRRHLKKESDHLRAQVLPSLW